MTAEMIIRMTMMKMVMKSERKGMMIGFCQILWTNIYIKIKPENWILGLNFFFFTKKLQIIFSLRRK